MPRQNSILPPAISHAAKRNAGRTLAEGTPLHIRGHHVTVGPALERYVRDRTSRKLGKYAYEEQRLTVRFEDLNGPKRGIDIACRIQIVVPAAPSIVVEERAATPRDAFDLAIVNAERALRHSLDKHGRTQGGKPSRGKKHLAALDAAARAEVRPDTERAVRRTPKNQLARAPKAVAALEDSNGKPSRKSTRASSNHIKQGTPLTLRQQDRMNAPEARRGRRGGN